MDREKWKGITAGAVQQNRTRTNLRATRKSTLSDYKLLLKNV